MSKLSRLHDPCIQKQNNNKRIHQDSSFITVTRWSDQFSINFSNRVFSSFPITWCFLFSNKIFFWIYIILHSINHINALTFPFSSFEVLPWL